MSIKEKLESMRRNSIVLKIAKKEKELGSYSFCCKKPVAVYAAGYRFIVIVGYIG